MATVPVSLQPSGYIKTVNKDGIEVVTDFKLISVSLCLNSPIYTMEEICPNCNGNQFKFLVQGKTCAKCNEKITNEGFSLKMRLEYMCPKCGIRYDPNIVHMEASSTGSFLIKNGVPSCPECNIEMTYVMSSEQEIKSKDDDIIENRFEILDL